MAAGDWLKRAEKDKPYIEQVTDVIKQYQKKRKKIIGEGCTEEELYMLDWCIERLSSIPNRYNNILQKAEKAEAEQKAQEKKAKMDAYWEKFQQESFNNQVHKFNQDCKHYCMYDGEHKCDIKMDMTFCGKNCAYATTSITRAKLYDAPTLVNRRKV